MDLYDDLDTKQRAGQIDGWSSGIKMLQTQLAIKKATLPPPKKELLKKPAIRLMTPVIINKKATEEDIFASRIATENLLKTKLQTTKIAPTIQPSAAKVSDYDWDVVDEYDPLWPNEYEKLVKEKREKDDRRDSRKDLDRKRKGTRFAGSGGGGSGSGSAIVATSGVNSGDDSPPAKYSGFGNRPAEDDSYSRSPPANSRVIGAAIAPPPSLQESSPNSNNENSSNVTIPYGANSVAAKIMAKYGFKDGQGLGKQEQGMSMALQVEKTSKRGGRIIHEKELLMQPPPPPAAPSPPVVDPVPKAEPSITEIMKSPSKVVLLRNMVGPGEVDSELEPEVKDECNSKYGEVVSVIINEINGTPPEEAVRIFVEFKRIESAIKAVVDLNGRFFGGRQVRAGFFNYDKFKNSQLCD